MADLDNYLTLMVAVFRAAIFDAQRGNAEAIEFLDHALPDWRERMKRWRRSNIRVVDHAKSKRAAIGAHRHP